MFFCLGWGLTFCSRQVLLVKGFLLWVLAWFMSFELDILVVEKIGVNEYIHVHIQINQY